MQVKLTVNRVQIRMSDFTFAPQLKIMKCVILIQFYPQS